MKSKSLILGIIVSSAVLAVGDSPRIVVCSLNMVGGQRNAVFPAIPDDVDAPATPFAKVCSA